MNFPHGETVVIVRPSFQVDTRYNNRVADWENVTEFILTQCGIAPGASAEFTEHRELGLEIDHTVYVSPVTGTGIYGWSELGEPIEAIQPSDALRFRGQLHSVVGPIEVWHNPFTGWRPGCVVMTKRTEG